MTTLDLPTFLDFTDRTLSPAQKTELDERGYLVLPGPFEARDLPRLRTSYDRACDAAGLPTRGTRHPVNLLEHEPAFADFLAFPPLLAAVFHILGRPFRAGLGGRDPLPGYGQQGLHVDCVDLGPSTPYQVVTAFGLLDAFTVENGATRLVPGTHILRRSPLKAFTDPASRHPEQIIVTAPAGAVLVFNGHVWHGGTLNRSGERRRSVQCSFTARDQTRLDAGEPPPSELPPTVRYLLGADPE